MLGTVFAPWTDEEIESLNGYQKSGVFHEFTCGICGAVLIAERYAWKCSEGCSYTQNWAWRFMADGTWKRSAEVFGWKNES